jgi:hypothetical protein
MNRRKTYRTLVATVCLAALSACGSSASVAGGTTSAAVASPATAAPTGTNVAIATTSPAAAVPASLQFEATLVGGASFTGASRVGVPTAFWFWAPT